MKEKTFVYSTDSVVIMHEVVRKIGTERKEPSIGGFTLYQRDEDNNAVRAYMSGEATIKRFSAFLTEHVGLPSVDWDALAKEVERHLFSDAEEERTPVYLAAYQDTFALIREFYESNQLPRPTDK